MPDPTYVTIPDLTAATDGSINDDLLLEAAIPDGGSYVSRKVTKGQLVSDLKEDIEQLDGLSDDVKNALLAIAQNVVYKNDDADYYQNLYDALYPPAQTYTVTNTLTGCTTSNTAIAVTENTPYSATITASSGYSLTGATVSIIMGGTDITATAYNNGVISIASVTGNLNITVTAVAVTLSSITAVYTQGGTVYDVDSLDTLEADLVVTAHYSDSSSETISSGYILSGTLTVGTSTVTVTYSGKTTTFTVTASAKYYYDMTDGISVQNGGIVPSAKMGYVRTYGEIIMDGITLATRRAFPTTLAAPRSMKYTSVENPYPADLSDTTFYPIKIPSDATKVTISITPNTQYISAFAYKYTDENHYTSDFVNNKSQTGWAQGTGTLTFTAGEYQYISVASKCNNAGTSYPTEPTALSVTFTTT